VPTVFARNHEEFDKLFCKVIEISKNVQIDFMDGLFVKTKGVGLMSVPDLHVYKNHNFEAHLMVEHPDTWVRSLKKKGFKKVLFHFEAYNDVSKIKRLVNHVIQEDLIPGVVFNPRTKFKNIIEVKDFCPIIMFMGHRPGIEGKSLKRKVLRNIKKLRDLDKEVVIQVDGGVNNKTVGKLVSAGVDIVSIGSYISKSKNPGEVFWNLKSKFFLGKG
jgi:ribulose-phosphate 3-epimerase